MKQKEKALLMQLIEHKEEYVTSQYLASILSLSDRTVRNYVKKLKDILLENGAEIIAKQGHGYQLKVVHKFAFNYFLSQLEIVVTQHDQSIPIAESADRKNYLLNKLLLEDEVIFLDDLAEELYISRSSLSKDVQEIREQLKPYGLSIVSKHCKGMWIVGEERNKRHFIMDTFFGKNYTNSLKEYLGSNHFFQDISFEELTIIILDETREAKLKIADFVMHNLVLHLSLGIKRLREGCRIKDLGLTNDVTECLEYQVAEHIIRRIELVTDVIFPTEEIAYLTLHLMAKSNHQSTADVNQKLGEELNIVLAQVSEAVNYPLLEDYQLKNGLLDHLTPMLVRLKRGIKMENPLTADIKKENLTVFELTKRFFRNMPVLKNYQINDDEWAYLALHVMAALEKAQDAYKVHALIICATGYGSAQLLKNRVINEFGKHIAVKNVQGYYEINAADLAGIDLIISSIDLSTMLFKIPVLHVSVFLNDEDVQLIRQTLNQLFPCKPPVFQKKLALSPEAKQYYYTEKIVANLFKIYYEPPTKDLIISDLLQLLGDDESEEYVSKMIKQIEQRERMGQIVFSDQIAVPHPAIPIGVSTKIAVGLIPQGMVWGEKTTLKFVFLLSPSCISNEGITVVTNAIVRLVDRADIQENILLKPTFENFRNQLAKLI